MKVVASLLLTLLAVSYGDRLVDPVVSPVNYTNLGMDLQGFLALPDNKTIPAPAVVILPDWDGVNFYEQQRATMLAKELGYVGFAADIYGADKHNVSELEERREQATLYRSNATLYVSRINAAIATVKAMPEVDGDKVAVIGYCFGGTGVITYGLMGEEQAVALVSFHGGLTGIPDAGPAVRPKLLILSGGEDDTATQIYDLEATLNAANSTWEITRYSDIEHGFTNFEDDRYNEWADLRSWDSMAGFLREAFGEKPFDGRMPNTTSVEAVDYTDVDGAELRGYLAMPSNTIGASLSLAPGVAILPDWDGVNLYEQQRATLLANAGYVAFAADIYGKDLQEGLSFDDRRALSSLYRNNATLFVQRIDRAIEQIKLYPEVDETKIAVIGYCFGGTGVIEYAFADRDDVKVVASFHGGLQSLPESSNVTVTPYVLVLSGGIDDANGNQTVLEETLDEGDADWEITRYSNVDHGFTSWTNSDYNLRADARSWESMMQVFEELIPIEEGGEGTTEAEGSDTSSASFSGLAGVASVVGMLWMAVMDLV